MKTEFEVDEDLDNRLIRLREKLRQKNFTSDGKHAAICSDNVLGLLAYYKPTTLDDMRNITGIGETFINLYGPLFLEAIKKHIKSEEGKGELLSSSETEILNLMENRLVNINSRNRMLYSGKLNKDFGVDLTKYIEDNSLEEFILKQKTGKLKLLKISNVDDSKEKVILKLLRAVEKEEIDSGKNELYIGYPFLQGKLENENFIIKAPLMIFPVRFVRNADTIYLENDSSRDILYNNTLILANNKFSGKNEVLPDNVIESIDSEKFVEQMIDFYKEQKLYIKKEEYSIESFFENTKSEFPNYKNGELELKGYMVLGLFSTYVTSLYEDFHNIINSGEVTKLIKELINGMEQVNSNFDINYEETEENNDLETEEEIEYINDLDFSQEKVLKDINKNDSLVIQGPPGTGKSQTITSIIAQCILKGKNVLMVSEKKTALDVIVSRLGELSNFTILIDDIENKNEFYDQVRKVIDCLKDSSKVLSDIIYKRENNPEQLAIQSIEDEISSINENLKYLNEISEKIYANNSFGASMFDIYNACKKIDVTNEKKLEIYNYVNDNITNTLKSLSFKELNSVVEKIEKESNREPLDYYIEKVSENEFLNNFKQNLNDMELAQLEKLLLELKNYIIEYNQYNFFKKIFNKSLLNDKVNSIINNYCDYTSKEFFKSLLSETDYYISFVKEFYNDYEKDRFLYDHLSLPEKEYINLLSKIKNNFEVTYLDASFNIYNNYLFKIIADFEKENSEVLKYIDNFEHIKNEIYKNIEEKREYTMELAYYRLVNAADNMTLNGKLSKIEEMTDRKRKMAIKKFMSKYNLELMDSIKIWLMTPEVVSDILPLNKNMFDMVIFDEASQLFVEKSIPAIYRAKSIVIAGDQKQLKPSSLFQGRVEDEEDENEKFDGFLEYESLLDAAHYKYPHTMLNYHYRSRHSELIDFSNYAFYGGKLLVTSLANQNDNLPIERIKVENGLWSNRQNLAEANETIQLIKKILKERKNNETFGVITFNINQMNLIEELIEKEKMKDSDFAIKLSAEEKRQDDGQNVGFFVKNIETVQGDERDIIIFCIGYARDERGRVNINFGTLNQDGGENRLNVAISRAKQKIYVITSIEPEELEVDSTKNDGPKLFKEYLRYVKAISNGDNELSKSILLGLLDTKDSETKGQATFDSVFEEQVYSKLIEDGYNVVTQYGVGGYKIDIVVQDKNHKNILGIECDGRQYHSSKSARERDYYRQKYLESRGWKIYRIWSTNWWKNSSSEYRKLKNLIDKMIKNN